MGVGAHLRSYVCGVALAAIFAGVSPAALARSTAAPLPEILVAELPPEGREILDRIKANRRFRYERDGAVFGNRERILPPRPRGYYREYTVRTPGAANRGARRIVCGGIRPTPAGVGPTPKNVRAKADGVTPAPTPCFYTDDHYQSFSTIRE